MLKRLTSPPSLQIAGLKISSGAITTAPRGVCFVFLSGCSLVHGGGGGVAKVGEPISGAEG